MKNTVVRQKTAILPLTIKFYIHRRYVSLKSQTQKQIILGSFAILTVLGGVIISEQGKAQQETKKGEVVDMLAAKTVEKFSSMSCPQLAASLTPQAQATEAKDPKKAQIQAKFLAALKADPDLKTRFFNQVSTPIVTKMFDCGMIPKQ